MIRQKNRKAIPEQAGQRAIESDQNADYYERCDQRDDQGFSQSHSWSPTDLPHSGVARDAEW